MERLSSSIRYICAPVTIVLICALFITFTESHAAAQEISIASPANDANVSGVVYIDATAGGDVWWAKLYVDGQGASVSPPYVFTWDSTTVPDGSHTLTVKAFARGGATPIAISSIIVNVNNSGAPVPTAQPTIASAPTPTPVLTPTPTPTPDLASQNIVITSPSNGAPVSGTVSVNTRISSNVWWAKFYVDGAGYAVSPPYDFTWNSTSVADGNHTLTVKAFARGSTTPIGTSSIIVMVNNNGGPIPTATGTPTPISTATPTPKPTATSTSSATATPTSTPTPTPIPTATSTPTTANFYVSPRGSDSNDGSSAHPWRTIQHAVNQARAGQVIDVEAGSYGENVTIPSSGSSGSPITLETVAGASLRSIIITGSNWKVSGFDISNQTNGDKGYGIYITGSASYDTVTGNYIHQLCQEGVYMDPTVSHITVSDNKIYHAEMAGIEVDGQYDMVNGNEIWGTSQYPDRLGGIYSGCAERGGADADAIRFFGEHHVISGNYMHDIAYGTTDNPSPHIDCFQTWGSSAIATGDDSFDGNTCRWPNGSQGEIGMIEARDGSVGALYFENNVFADMLQGLNVSDNSSMAIDFWNNTVDHIMEEAVIFLNGGSSNDQVVNNIFYDVGGGDDSFICGNGGVVVQANDHYMRSGSPGTYCSNATAENVNPLFVNSGDSTGSGADYHLQSSSPCISAGVTLSDVTDDLDGVSRPAGSYSEGAYQK